MTFSSTVFWKDAAERAVKTFAQALVAVLAVSTTITEVDWPTALGTAGLAALVSLLTSIAGTTTADRGTASLVHLDYTEEKQS